MDGARKMASLAENEEGKNVIQIEFPYDLDLLEKVRSLPRRKYHSSSGCWSVPFSTDSINSLQDWGFLLDKELRQYVEKQLTKKDNLVQQGIPGLKGKLYPFQLRGVSFIDQNHGRVLLADEMGLGKTIQAIAWLQLHPEFRPAVIITPASVKLNWAKEIRGWMTHPNFDVLYGSKPYETTEDILIINYDVLYEWRREIRRRKPSVIITDECHYYKDSKAKRTIAIKRISGRALHFIAISGTPITNRPSEFFNALNILLPDTFENFY